MIRLTSILLGVMFGLLFAINKGAFLEAPMSVGDEWGLRIPAKDEFMGTPQLGQGISISNGRLWFYRQQLYASDVLYREDIPEKGTLRGTLDSSSGLLVVGLIGEELEYIFIDPMHIYTESLEESGIPLAEHTFVLQWTENGVFIEPQHIQITDVVPQKIEFMTASTYASLKHLSLESSDGWVFQEDFTQQGRTKSQQQVLFACLGGILGLLVSFLEWRRSGFFLRLLIAHTPLLFVTFIPRYFWLWLGIRLYLVETPMWVLEKKALFLALVFHVFYCLLHSRWFTLPKENNVTFEKGIWFFSALIAIGIHPFSSIWEVVYLLVVVAMPLLLGKRLQSKKILYTESVIFGMSLLWGLPWVCLLLILFRWVVLLSNIRVLFASRANRAAEYAFLLLRYSLFVMLFFVFGA